MTMKSTILRLLVAVREVRRVEESPGRAADEPATVDRVDAVAGSEFVDDRIRLPVTHESSLGVGTLSHRNMPAGLIQHEASQQK